MINRVIAVKMIEEARLADAPIPPEHHHFWQRLLHEPCRLSRVSTRHFVFGWSFYECAMPDMPEIHIASNLPSTFARPDYKRVLLSARQVLLVDRISNAVLFHQPVPRRGLDQGHVDGAPMPSADLFKFKCPVGDKRIHQFWVPN